MRNIHATGILVGDRGVIITGPSGSGKTTLALALVAACEMRGRFARLVGDDQLFLRRESRRLIAVAPRTIAGLAEIRGLGPHPFPAEPSMIVDLLVRLVPCADVPRMDARETVRLEGCAVPRIDIAARCVDAALPAVLARLASRGVKELNDAPHDLGLSTCPGST